MDLLYAIDRQTAEVYSSAVLFYYIEEELSQI